LTWTYSKVACFIISYILFLSLVFLFYSIIVIMLSLGRTFCILVLLSSFSYANRKFFHIFTPYSMSNNGDALTCSISMSMYLLSSDITNDLEGLSVVKIRHIPTGSTAPPLCVVPATFYQSSPRAWQTL